MHVDGGDSATLDCELSAEPGVNERRRGHPARARLPARAPREDRVGAQETTDVRQPASP